MTTFEESLDAFASEIKSICLVKAKEKGYHGNEEDGRKMYDMVHNLIHGHGHAFGEIVYKLARFQETKNLTDIAKVAAWAFLAWDKEQR